MIESAVLVTQTGIVLYFYSRNNQNWSNIKPLIDEFFSLHLIETESFEVSRVIRSEKIAYPSVLSLDYTETLRKRTAKAFRDMFPSADISNLSAVHEKFDGVFRQILKQTATQPLREKTKNVAKEDKNGTKKEKKKRVWDDQVTDEIVKSLDYSSNSNGSGTNQKHVAAQALVDKKSLGSVVNGTYDAKEIDDVSDDDESQKQREGTTGVLSMFSNLVGGKVLQSKDLEPVGSMMKEHLISKNVAADVASVLCESVTTSLVGAKLSTFSSINTLVRQTLEESIRKILTPKTSIDLLQDINKVNAKKKCFSFVFVGVNGVGKSTNLSKIAFWLLQNKKKILIAACDTFRSGAVEQLRVHARNLKALVDENAVVDLYEKGYGKDSAGIAKEAMAFANKENYDVVLIDTAGRMQDNEPLMRALAKLVYLNNPDRIVFVGEALVGNEAIDQLSKFNRSLKDFSFGATEVRQIDGMILTKFDTIDDKVFVYWFIL